MWLQKVIYLFDFFFYLYGYLKFFLWMNVSTRSSKFLSRVTIQHSAYIRFCIQNSEINHLQLLTFIDYTKLRVKTGIGKEFIGSNNSVSQTFQSLTFYVSDCKFNSSRWAYIYKFKREAQRPI